MTIAVDPFARFSGSSSDQWLAVLKRSIKEPEIDGVRFPGFPDEGTQVLFTSLKWETALDEAFAFYKVATAGLSRWSKPLQRSSRYLDFGVGWGRIARMFLKDVAGEGIRGVDVTPQILGVCQSLMPVGTYSLVEPRGSLELEPASFDLATAFSVFSHLSPESGLHWMQQLHRVLKPKSLLVVTTLSRSFVELCRGVMNDPEASDWHRGMSAHVRNGMPDWKTKLAKFPKDEVLYLPAGGGFTSMAPQDYGWAMVPEGWARKNWAKWFDVREYVDDPKVLPQAYFILQRKP